MFIVVILMFRRGIVGTIERLMLFRRAPAGASARTAEPGEPVDRAAPTSR